MRRLGRLMSAAVLALALTTAAHAAPATHASDQAAAGAARVNVNTASAAELAKLPGIGPAKAQAIVEYRAKSPFALPDDLVKVKGIGPKLLDQIRDRITVGDAPASSSRGG
jgi:competence protein ComEA